MLYASVNWHARKPIGFELTVIRIGHHDITNFNNCFFVLIHISLAHFMQTSVIVDFEITQWKVDCDWNINFPPLSQVLDNWGPLFNWQTIEMNCCTSPAPFLVFKVENALVEHLNVFKVTNYRAITGMITFFSKTTHWNSQWQVLVIVTKLSHCHLMFSPFWFFAVKFIFCLKHADKIFLIILACTFNHKVRIIRAKTQNLLAWQLGR